MTDDRHWASWSQQQLERAAAQDELAIKDIVYAELSIGYAWIEELDAMISTAGLLMAPLPQAALFLAGKAFQRYRAAGGTRTGVLADFSLGPHAVISACPLLSCDAERYRTYFPGIRLIAPD